MKKTFLSLLTVTFISGIILISCNNSSQKVDKAQKDVIEANKNLEDANKEYLADIEIYRTETANRIAANDQSIVELKAKIANDKKIAKADFKKKVAELEQKNIEMKKKMDEYKADGKENWEQFKTEFSRDMDELGNAFKDLTVKNTR